jgi:nicotinamide mononucleotide transporter
LRPHAWRGKLLILCNLFYTAWFFQLGFSTLDIVVTFLLENWLELTGFVSGLLCVWLLIKESVSTFPIGMLYALVTTIVVARAFLYADVLLNLYYVLMNAYGWYYWLYGAKSLRQDQGELRPQPIGASTLWVLLAITAVGTLLMGYLFQRYSQADLAYVDSLTTVASFVAMWMSARKFLASWIAWFLIDLVQIVLYIVKGLNGVEGLYLYAGLYSIYLLMAVWGWQSWRQRLQTP